MAHDINRDPEMWDLCAQFGDKALRCWLEILSIADRNDGIVPGQLNSISTSVAWTIRCKTTRVQQMINTMTTTGWLHNDNGLRVVNWAKYHRTRVPNQPPSEPSEPSIPNLTIKNPPNPPKKRPPKKQKEAVVDLVFERFWDQYPRKEKKQTAYKAWCVEAKHCKEIQDAIFAALDWQIDQPQWLKDDGQYIPHPTTWLNQKRWDDKPMEVKSHGPEPKGFAGLREWAKYREQK